MPTAEDIKKWLQMQPNPAEGGFLAPTYGSTITIPDAVLPGFAPAGNARVICGAIYYLLDRAGCSVLHKVTGDMLYHFYDGDPVQMLLLYPDGHPVRTEVFSFSNDIASGGRPMKTIPGGTWLGSRLVAGGSYALMGVTMAPGFHPNDYTIGDRKALIAQYPEHRTLIEALTR